MSSFRTKLKDGFLEGIKKGWGSFVWICKIVIPLSLLVAILQWTGWLNQMDFLLNPLTRLINLPPEAALPIISGMLINLYAAIAIITVVPFTIGQMTLIAVFNLIAHSLIMEGIIQHKSGMNIAKITAIRIGAAIVTVLIVSRFLGDTSQSVTPVNLAFHTGFLDVLRGWAIGMVGLLIKIFSIVTGIMIALGCFKSLGWNDYILKFFRPLGKVFGLKEHTAMMFMAAEIFGLLYGGAVIVEESKKEPFTREELDYLHISIGINHSMVEDPALFTMLGLNAFWMWVPKLIMAIIVVQSYRGLKYVKNRLVPQRAV
ncbi:MAG: iron transporter [Chloroflexota bacterium]